MLSVLKLFKMVSSVHIPPILSPSANWEKEMRKKMLVLWGGGGGPCVYNLSFHDMFRVFKKINANIFYSLELSKGNKIVGTCRQLLLSVCIYYTK
jgi:hypothetical protein